MCIHFKNSENTAKIPIELNFLQDTELDSNIIHFSCHYCSSFLIIRRERVLLFYLPDGTINIMENDVCYPELFH